MRSPLCSIHLNYRLILAISLNALTPLTFAGDHTSAENREQPGQQSEYLHSISLENLLKITVTIASRFNEDEINLGSSVSKITRQEWINRGADRLREALATQVATVISPSLWDGSAIAIRGFFGNTSSSAIAVQLDDVPMTLLRTNSALFDTLSYQLGALNSLELIRGPGSAIHGSDAFHGVIAANTYSASEDQRRMSVKLGSLGFSQADINISQGLNQTHRINSAFAYSRQNSLNQDYRNINLADDQLITGERDLDYNAYTGVVKLNSDFSSQLSSYLNLYAKGRHSDQGPGLGPNRDTLDIDHSDSDEDFYMVKAGFSQTFANQLILEGNGYFWDTDITRTFSRYRAGQPTQDQIFFEESHKGLRLYLKQADNPWNTQWLLGLEASRARLDDNHNRRISLADNSILREGINVSQGYERKINSLVFQAKTHLFNDHLDLLYGLRIDNYLDAFGHQNSPRLGIIYYPDEDQAIKLLYGQAFTPPSSLDIFGGVTIKGNREIGPEIIDTYELVYIRHSDHWKLNVTLFKSDWSDGILAVSTTDPNFSLEFSNIGEQTAQGIELSYQYVQNNWSLKANAAYVDSKNETENFDYDSFPDYIINLELGYQLSHYPVEFFIQNQWHINRDSGAVVAGAIEDPNELPDYFRLDISGHWQASKNWRLSGYIHNVFDRDNATPSTFSLPEGHPDEELNFSLSLNYRF
ncbi:TonB-dependent receptor plug domain-containing protein [Thalassomonas actiniarum]|uniref:TonB-dependent receptor n=1 Tax=Thalassomonas actiniarum TaxID=485447 RepID=A0AAE9YW30_9GAMM|nr:TonB-dependent receptor [Thalassomonas actiniarum]WDE00623.1 TonB-dependent receptor [Thalassomonas actiniarum]